MSVGCLQAVHELLQRMRQPFGLIRRPDRHRRGRFPGVRPRRRANARCRCVQCDHARPWRRPEVDGLAPAASLDKVQGRAGNRERREHDHQQSKSVIDVSDCGSRRFGAGLRLLPTLLLSCAMRRGCVAVRARGRAARDGDGEERSLSRAQHCLMWRPLPRRPIGSAPPFFAASQIEQRESGPAISVH